MRYLFYVIFLFSFQSTYSQIWSPGTGLVTEDDPKHNGFVNGKIYFNDGMIKEGLVLFPYTHTDQIRFKPSEDSDFQKFVADEIKGFTLLSDTFAVIANFSPEIVGTTANTFFEKGFAKVLINGPISLFKHYSLQSVRNMQIVTIESFIVARSEEDFTRFTTLPTSKREFVNATTTYFKRNKDLTTKIFQNNPSFLALREIVKEYNDSYLESEKEPEISNITIFRPKKKESEKPIHITLNDSVNFELGVSDLRSFETNTRINKVCIDGGTCVLFRANKDVPHFIECSSNVKLLNPRALYVHPLYAEPIIRSIQKRKN